MLDPQMLQGIAGQRAVWQTKPFYFNPWLQGVKNAYPSKAIIYWNAFDKNC